MHDGGRDLTPTRRSVAVGISTVTMRLRERSPSARRALLAEAADAGVDHLHVGDHVAFRGGQGFDGLIAASALLNLQDRLPVQVGAYLLTLRHPTVAARQLIDLWSDHPSRLVVAVGAGGDDPEEMAACGVSIATRGRRMDESLLALRGLLAGTATTVAGEHVTLSGVTVAPGAPGLPLLVAGRSDAALRRAARHGNGWLAIWVSADRFATAVRRIATAAERAGRRDDPHDAAERAGRRDDPHDAHDPHDHGLAVWCGFDCGPASTGRRDLDAAMAGLYGIDPSVFARWCPAGPPEAIAEFLAPYVAAGARTISIIPAGRDPESDIAAVAQVRALLGS